MTYSVRPNIVIVKRADDGSISEIFQQSPLGDRRTALRILFASGCFLLLYPWLMQLLQHSTLDLAAALKIDLLAVFVLLLVGFMSQPGVLPNLQVADRDGINFNYYRSLGQIPWTDIDSIDFRGSSLGLMSPTLVVRLKNPDEWIAQLKPGSDFDPRRGSMTPFATLADSAYVDIHTLQKSLIEMKAQMAGQQTSLHMPYDPLSDATLISEPVTFGRHVEQ